MESPWQTFLSAKDTPLGMIMLCSLLSTIAFSLVTGLFTLFSEHRLHWHARENGLLFAFIGFIGVIVQGGMLRRLVPRMGEKPLVIFGTLVLCVSMALLPVSADLTLILIASSGLAIGNSFVTPLLSGLASKAADEQSQGVMLGLMQSIASLGRMLGPMLGGVLMNFDLHHPNIPYSLTPYWTAALLMLGGLLAAWRLSPAPAHTVHVQE